MSWTLDERERDRLAEEILSRLGLQIAVEYPSHGSSFPRLRVALLDGTRELATGWVDISELNK